MQENAQNETSYIVSTKIDGGVLNVKSAFPFGMEVSFPSQG